MTRKSSGSEASRRSFTLGELARLLDISLKGNPQVCVQGVNALERAGSGELSFLTHERYLPLLSSSRVAALIVPPSFEHLDRPLLISKEPYASFAQVAQLFADPPFLPPGIHPSAFIAQDAHLEPEVSVGPLAHIGSGTSIGRGTRVYGGAYVGSKVRVGEECLIHPKVSLLDGCVIGNRVIVHSGTVVGSDGFGFAQDHNGRHIKIPQTGTVQIDDDVEIGANCTIDRATFDRTWIQEGTKIDNLVHIAHNVVVGRGSILVAQVGIAGSTRIGSHVMLGGQVGVVGHIEIGDRVRIGAQSGVGRSVKEGEDLSGSPAVAHKEWLRMYAAMRRLPQFRDELRQIKDRIGKIEEILQGNDHD